MSNFRNRSVHDLTPDRIAQAYPLAQLALGNCPVAAWEAYARRHLALERQEPAACGILVAEDDEGTIFGLLVYQFAEKAGQERRFQAKTVIVTDPFTSGRLDVAFLLLDAGEQIARDRACSRAEIFLPTERGPREAGWWARVLENRGYTAAGTHYFRPL